jgi:hypothetical protein
MGEENRDRRVTHRMRPLGLGRGIARAQGTRNGIVQLSTTYNDS